MKEMSSKSGVKGGGRDRWWDGLHSIFLFFFLLQL